jgi:hypothetical protein
MLNRRWLREPWALLAQVILLFLIIAALANPHWGRQDASRSVVMVLDTSIWSQAQPRGESPWIDDIREEADRVLDSLPPTDRVLLLRAEPDALPILPFTSDRSALKRAIADVSASSVVADVPSALELGKAALTGSRRGLLVYVGPGLLDEQQAGRLDEFRRRLAESSGGEIPPQFLARLVGDPAAVQNRGITGLALRRNAEHPDQWSVLTEVKNYSSARANIVLNLSVGGKALQQRSLSLAPGEVKKVEDAIVWRDGGVLQAEISPPDALAVDDRAAVEMPSFRLVRVAVFSAGATFANELDAVLAANPYISAESLGPAATATDKPDVAIYAGVNPSARLTVNSIWFLTGAVRGSSTPVRIANWDSQHPATRWIRTRDVSVRNPAPLPIKPGDIVLASAEGNPPTPLILAREQDGHRMLILGFDPHNSSLQFEAAFPLLMAGSIEWLTQPVEDIVQSPSTGVIDLRSPATQILAPSGAGVPFERTGLDVHFFASQAGIYHFIEPGRTSEIAVNIPALPQERWNPTSSEETSIEREPIRDAGRNLWRWLIALALIPVWLEWWLFYSGRGIRKVEIKPETLANAPPPGEEFGQRWGRSKEETHHDHGQFIN